MIDLLEKNKEMLDKRLYNVADTRQLSRIAGLKNPNDYDLYLIVCALCNYDLPEKLELYDIRMQYYLKIKDVDPEQFAHKDSDYTRVDCGIHCRNTGAINSKYGHYIFAINSKDKQLINDLWAHHAKDCLKYVDDKSDPEDTLISVSREQFPAFLQMLDKMNIYYNKKNMEKNLVFSNNARNTLIDINQLDLPDWMTPKDYQIEDAQYILKHKRMLLGHQMGVGKSLISILVGESLNMPKLVICPESLRLDWYQKIEQANNSADIQVQMSNQAPHFGKDWTIIGYKTVSKFLPNLKRYFKCIFVDECQWCKSVNNWGKPDSKRAEAVIDLAQSVEYCYLLSGTPIPSKNKDLFNILKMLRCESFDFNNQWAFKNYGDKFCDPKDNGFGMNYDGNSNSEELHQLIKPLMIRRLRKEVFPNLTKMRRFVPIEPHFKKDYKQVEYLLRHPERDIFGKIEPTSTAMALSMTGRKLLSSYKIDAAIELAESRIRAEESVVIVTCFNETANMLKAHFKDNACEIRGGMTDKAKELAKADFQNKNKAVCILNLQAGQVGLTLTAAHVMIVIDYFWNPTDMEQVEDRICRMGQNEDCLIYYIYCTNSTLDNIFVETLTDKSYNIDKVVDNKDQGEYNLRIERDKSAMQKLEELARATC